MYTVCFLRPDVGADALVASSRYGLPHPASDARKALSS